MQTVIADTHLDWGMQFESREDAHHFFHFYGFLAGFDIVVTHASRTTDKKRNNEVFKIEMKCHCYGKPKKKKTKGDEEEEIDIQTNNKNKGPKRKTNV